MVHVEPFEDGREARFIALAKTARDILAVSPFVTVGAARLLLLGSDPRRVRLITRFNLEDFVIGVSHLRALEELVKAGGKIRGRRGLHSKLYIFDDRSIIVSSANLTQGGLTRNLEFGLQIEGKQVVAVARSYFEHLWDLSDNDLTASLISEWKDAVDAERARRGHNKHPKGQLADFGSELESQPTPGKGRTQPSSFGSATTDAASPGTRVFVKFFGTAEDRWDSERHVREALQRSECHYAGTYPLNKRPRRIGHGDIVYMAFMTKNPVDYSVFGRAVAIPHVPGRDDATANEIARQKWKSKWPHYIRVFDPVFIDAPLSECVFLGPIIGQLGAHALSSTAKNLASGAGNLDPRRALRQKPDVEMTAQGAQELAEQFGERLRSTGPVPTSFIDTLPRPDIQVDVGGRLSGVRSA